MSLFKRSTIGAQVMGLGEGHHPDSWAYSCWRAVGESSHGELQTTCPEPLVGAKGYKESEGKVHDSCQLTHFWESPEPLVCLIGAHGQCTTITSSHPTKLSISHNRNSASTTHGSPVTPWDSPFHFLWYKCVVELVPWLIAWLFG